MSLGRNLLLLLAIYLMLGADFARAVEMPVGIPNPNSTVPSAIMPSLPTANAQIQAFPYDPIETPTPTWQDGENQYYVNNRNNSCADSANGGHGTPAEPLCNIPGMGASNWTLSAGDQVFVVGDGASYGSYNDVNAVKMDGTASRPIWIIGVGETKPKFLFERFVWTRGTHVFFDNVHFYSPADNFRMKWTLATGPIEYFTFRNVSCSGSEGTHSEPSRRCFSMGGSPENILRFVVFHNLDVWGLGRWQDDRKTSRDLLGFQVQKWSRYIWILNSRVRNMQGDSIMCGNSNWWDYDQPSRPHYVYIGGNELYENYENAYDQKGCYHVIFSENRVHDFFNAYKSANNTAIITEQDSEGDIGGRFTWFINNVVERAGTAFASKATTNDAHIFILGNVIRDVRSSALVFTQRCYQGGSAGPTCPRGLTFAQNTVDCGLAALAVSNPQNPNGSNQRVEVDGNIFFNCHDGRRGTPHAWESFSDGPLHLVYAQNAHFRSAGGNISLPLRWIDEFESLRSSLNKDLEFVASDNIAYELQASSPAVDLVSRENSAYALFQSMYDIDIRKDISGSAWSAMPINAGAFQSAGLPVPPRPMPPSSLE